jgi:hypothetical protein
LWKAYDARATAFEEKIVPKIVQAFDDQEQTILTQPRSKS